MYSSTTVTKMAWVQIFFRDESVPALSFLLCVLVYVLLKMARGFKVASSAERRCSNWLLEKN